MDDLEKQLKQLTDQASVIAKAKKELLRKQKMLQKLRETYPDAEAGRLPDDSAEGFLANMPIDNLLNTPGAKKVYFFDKGDKQYKYYSFIAMKLGTNEVLVSSDAMYTSMKSVLDAANNYEAEKLKKGPKKKA